MTVHSTLAKEAASWKTHRKVLKGPQELDHFIIEQDGRLWRLSIYPTQSLPLVTNGLSLGEANRRRLELSNEGYIGKVIGRHG